MILAICGGFWLTAVDSDYLRWILASCVDSGQLDRAFLSACCGLSGLSFGLFGSGLWVSHVTHASNYPGSDCERLARFQKNRLSSARRNLSDQNLWNQSGRVPYLKIPLHKLQLGIAFHGPKTKSICPTLSWRVLLSRVSFLGLNPRCFQPAERA